MSLARARRDIPTGPGGGRFFQCNQRVQGLFVGEHSMRAHLFAGPGGGGGRHRPLVIIRGHTFCKFRLVTRATSLIRAGCGAQSVGRLCFPHSGVLLSEESQHRLMISK